MPETENRNTPISIRSVEAALARHAQDVNEAMERFLPDGHTLTKDVVEAMRYSAMAGGKRIRPVLVLEFCKACGGDEKAAMPFACAVEMVHTYSLIHDDLPCMDDDDMRRGRPSCHVKFGEATALLAGDALLSLAFETALCHNDKTKVKSENVLRAAGILAKASGASGMVGGQIVDLNSEGHEISLETLAFMHNRKTGAMIMAAAQMGCVVAGADEARVKAAGAFAKRLGLAFQVIDDILDVTGSAEKLGKPIGSDADLKKSTYITHLGLEKSQKLAQSLTKEAIAQLQIFGNESAFLSGLAQYLATRDR